jgi:hypothetical protein
VEGVFRELSEAVLAQRSQRSTTVTGREIERIRAKFVTLRKSSYGVTGYPPEFVEAIYNDYMAHGEVVARIAARWNRNPSSIGALLAKWGLIERSPARRDAIKKRQRDSGARFAAGNRATPAELEEIIAAATKMAIPPQLSWEFKNWTMEKRAWFIGRLRAKLRSPDDRPETPFSANVEPFDYTTPRARAIKDRLNAGLNSQKAVCRIDIGSQGVIYKDELYYWAEGTGYCRRGAWTPEIGRPLLHRLIWEEVHGPLPAKHCVFFKDDNHNNFDPDNLGLMSMNENARRNQAAALFRKSRERTAALLRRSQRKEESHGLIEALNYRKAA